MRDIELYAQILGLRSPWKVAEVQLLREAEEVRVHVVPEPGATWTCPYCGRPSPGYDSRRRRWRHLDTCQYKTVLEADVPRVRCAEHGVVTVSVPWAEPGSGFTALFEALIIDWLKEASTQAVARQLKLSWHAIDRVMQRAVQRGMARRKVSSPQYPSVDETAFARRHEYVTVVTDQERGVVLHVADERKTESLAAYYAELSDEQKARIQAVAMDMWPAYIRATEAHIPQAEEKIAFDKFHVAKYLSEAVDKVRRQEHRSLLAVGEDCLKGSKYDWLTNPANRTCAQQNRFRALRDSSLKTARAWAIKEFAMGLWHYNSRTWAAKGWARWLAWAVRSRLEPVKRTAATIKKHLWGIINAVVLKVHNGHAESINSRIQRMKSRARGFRNRERFRNAIYFHLGGLDLYPAQVGNW
ncbi:MAG: ISL3 family transposase [Burkholderiales bacterium]|nr:MAG: ISL3 family transposase [Burkholderiales bacterium]